MPTNALRQTLPAAGADQAAVSYVSMGDPNGRRVLFVHGTPGSADAWSGFLSAVPTGFEYVAVDRPGFGLSGPRGPVISLARQAALMAPLLVTRSGHNTILVGHSLGGPIVARMAADFPAHVAGLVIVAGSLNPALERIQFIQRVGDTWPIRPLLPRMLRNTNEELLGLKPELTDLARLLPSISVPVVVVHGTKDPLVPFANVPFMEQSFTGAKPLETIVLDGQNHFLPWNSKPAIDQAIARVAGLS